MLAVQTTSITRPSSIITIKCPHNLSRLQITNRFFYYSTPVLWMLYLSNLVFTILVTFLHLSFCCLLFYFTKSLNPIFFLILVLHSLSVLWTGLLVLTLALFVFTHSHFHYSFIFISPTAILFYGLTLVLSLNKLSWSCSAFCLHFKSSSFT
jgi:hypothetical protein